MDDGGCCELLVLFLLLLLLFSFFFFFEKAKIGIFHEKVKVKNYFSFSIFVFQNIYLDRKLVQHVHGPYLSFLVLKKTQF